jgi:hypothetical protein
MAELLKDTSSVCAEGKQGSRRLLDTADGSWPTSRDLELTNINKARLTWISDHGIGAPKYRDRFAGDTSKV